MRGGVIAGFYGTSHTLKCRNFLAPLEVHMHNCDNGEVPSSSYCEESTDNVYYSMHAASFTYIGTCMVLIL